MDVLTTLKRRSGCLGWGSGIAIQFVEVAAVAEGPLADAAQGHGQEHRLQAGAVFKGAHPDAGYPLGQNDAAHAGAGQHVAAHSREAQGQGDAGQVLGVGKGGIADGGDAVGNLHLGDARLPECPWRNGGHVIVHPVAVYPLGQDDAPLVVVHALMIGWRYLHLGVADDIVVDAVGLDVLAVPVQGAAGQQGCQQQYVGFQFSHFLFTVINPLDAR